MSCWDFGGEINWEVGGGEKDNQLGPKREKCREKAWGIKGLKTDTSDNPSTDPAHDAV
jgi:hypothetical protein